MVDPSPDVDASVSENATTAESSARTAGLNLSTNLRVNSVYEDPVLEFNKENKHPGLGVYEVPSIRRYRERRAALTLNALKEIHSNGQPPKRRPRPRVFLFFNPYEHLINGN